MSWQETSFLKVAKNERTFFTGGVFILYKKRQIIANYCAKCVTTTKEKAAALNVAGDLRACDEYSFGPREFYYLTGFCLFHLIVNL